MKCKLSVLTNMFIALLFQSSFAQQVVFKESGTIINEKDYVFHDFAQTGTNYLIINYNYGYKDGTIADFYDKELNLISTRRIDEMNGTSYRGFIQGKNKLCLYSVNNKNQVFHYQYTGDKGTIDSKGELFSFKGEYTSFAKGYSKDSSYSFVLVVNSRGRNFNKMENFRDGVIMDKNLNIVARFSVAAQLKMTEVTGIHFSLSNEGVLNIITIGKGPGNNKKDGFRPSTYYITQVNKNNVSPDIQITDFPEGLLGSITWQTGEDPLSFTATISTTAEHETNAIVKGQFDIDHKKMTFSKISYIYNAATLAQSIKDNTSSNVPYRILYQRATLKKVFRLKDNSIIWILEYNNSIVKSTNVGEYTYSYNSVITVIKMSSDHEILWISNISKDQMERSIPTFTSSIAVLDANNGVHILFHDDIKNYSVDAGKKTPYIVLQKDLDNTGLADVYITNEGKTTKKFVIDNEDTEYHLLPTQSTYTSANEVISLSYKGNGKSSYKIVSLKTSNAAH